jgi:hypothetical protein
LCNSKTVKKGKTRYRQCAHLLLVLGPIFYLFLIIDAYALVSTAAISLSSSAAFWFLAT